VASPCDGGVRVEQHNTWRKAEARVAAKIAAARTAKRAAVIAAAAIEAARAAATKRASTEAAIVTRAAAAQEMRSALPIDVAPSTQEAPGGRHLDDYERQAAPSHVRIQPESQSRSHAMCRRSAPELPRLPMLRAAADDDASSPKVAPQRRAMLPSLMLGGLGGSESDDSPGRRWRSAVEAAGGSLSPGRKFHAAAIAALATPRVDPVRGPREHGQGSQADFVPASPRRIFRCESYSLVHAYVDGEASTLEQQGATLMHKSPRTLVHEPDWTAPSTAAQTTKCRVHFYQDPSRPAYDRKGGDSFAHIDKGNIGNTPLLGPRGQGPVLPPSGPAWTRPHELPSSPCHERLFAAKTASSP